MIWEGSTVYTPWKYKPVTKPAIQWLQKSDGNWSGVDRGTAQDVYESQIVFKGPTSELLTLETVLAANREDMDITCSTGEEIFGAEIDYSSAISVAVVDYGKITRTNFALNSMPLRLRLVETPSIVSTAASLSSLRLSNWKWSPNSEFDLIKIFSYDGTPTYLDGETDPGIFKAKFRQTQTEMEAIRRYLMETARTNTISSFDFSGFGVSRPFGQRNAASTFNVKIISWQDMGRINYCDWELSITFARVF